MTDAPPLVSTEWLAQQAADAGIVVLDASVFLVQTLGQDRGEFHSGLDRFASGGHIPGARFADLFVEFSDPNVALPFTRPQVTQFEAAAGRLGITPASHVVIYDALANQWAARLWWVFRSFGHRKVSVLDGGMRKYRKEGRALEHTLSPFRPANYVVAAEKPVVASRDDILSVLHGERKAHLVCFLRPDEYAGVISVRARPGHIPGSVNLPFINLLDDNNTFKSVPQLQAQFADVIDLDGRLVVTYCGAGIASTVGAFALGLINYRNTLEYDGSLSDWTSDPSLPVVLGY
jgi:thiosulfate/3-mercaptopyruvate sulfurtransferase